MYFKNVTLLIMLLFFSQISTASTGERHNFNYFTDEMTTFSIFSSFEKPDFLNDEYLYSLDLTLDERCTPKFLNISFINLNTNIDPNNKNDKIRFKFGSRVVTGKLLPFIENTIFFFEIPSNFLYSLNFSSNFQMEIDFQNIDKTIFLEFNINDEQKKKILSNAKECRRS